jgi:hypothetical protein
MTRSELEHLIGSAGAVSGDREIVIMGSQSILGQFPDAPVALLASMEADVIPLNQAGHSDLIDASMGEGSKFHEQFGYYAQVVSGDTATLPVGWRSRLISVCNPNTRGVTGLCLEVHDLAISKYASGRDKDLEFTQSLAAHGFTRRTTLIERLRETSISESLLSLIAQRIKRHFTATRRRDEPRSAVR